MGKSRLERIDKRLKQALPVVLLVLIGYLGVALLTDIKHQALYALEWALLSYFVFELVVKWLLSDSWRGL